MTLSLANSLQKMSEIQSLNFTTIKKYNRERSNSGKIPCHPTCTSQLGNSRCFAIVLNICMSIKKRSDPLQENVVYFGSPNCFPDWYYDLLWMLISANKTFSVDTIIYLSVKLRTFKKQKSYELLKNILTALFSELVKLKHNLVLYMTNLIHTKTQFSFKMRD